MKRAVDDHHRGAVRASHRWRPRRSAQEAQRRPARDEDSLRAGGGSTRQADRAGAVETRMTRARPYTAEAVIETLQMLADGNRIHRRQRDAGLSRQRGPHPSRDAQRRRNRAEHRRSRIRSRRLSLHARSRRRRSPSKDAGGGGRAIAGGVTRRGSAAWLTAGRRRRRSTVTATGRGEAGCRTRQRGGGHRRASGRGGGGRCTRVTHVGEAAHDGRRSNTRRSKASAPRHAGRPRSSRPARSATSSAITIISEQWFSPELQVLVMTRHTDPRTGETTYRLRNIIRAEPDPIALHGAGRLHAAGTPHSAEFGRVAADAQLELAGRWSVSGALALLSRPW